MPFYWCCINYETDPSHINEYIFVDDYFNYVMISIITESLNMVIYGYRMGDDCYLFSCFLNMIISFASILAVCALAAETRNSVMLFVSYCGHSA